MKPTAQEIRQAARMVSRSIIKAIRLRGGLTIQVFQGHRRFNRFED